MADIGGCSANEATSFASVSVAKRLCRIVRAVGCKAAVIMTKLKGNAAAAATPHPLPFGYCVFQHKQNAAFPLICLAIARHLLPSGRRHLWSCVFSILGRACQLSQSATPAFRIQLCPAGQRTAQLDARAGEARPKGKSRERPEESLLSSGRFRLSPAMRGSGAPSSFISAAFPSTTQVLWYFLDSRKYRNPPVL